MTDSAHIQDIARRFLEREPKMPKSLPKKAESYIPWSFYLDLLVQQEGGRYIILNRGMDDRIWERWFQHDRYGSICYAFASAFHCGGPIATDSAFHIHSLEWEKDRIRQINLICTRCKSFTQVNSVWFRFFQSDLHRLLCCHKRLSMGAYWKLFFWGMEMYNSLIGLINRNNRRSVIVLPPRGQWQTGSLRGNIAKRQFSESCLQVFDNGEYVPVPGVSPRSF